MRSVFIICLVVLLQWNFTTAEKEAEPNANINVDYHVWYDPNPKPSLDTEWLNVSVPHPSKFITVMDTAATQNNNRFGYEFIQYPFGKYITTIGGFQENTASKIHWMIYELTRPPSVENPPTDDQLAPVGVDELDVVDGKSYLFWLKVVDYQS